MTGFPPEAKWNELKCSDQQVPEPNTAFTNLVGPTVPTGEAEAPKFDFNETFDRPPFTAMTKVVKVNSRGKPAHDRHGQLLYEEVIREEGCADLDWLKKHKLTVESKPSAWINALLPLEKKTGDPKEIVTIDDWKEYTNTRAAIKTVGSSLYKGQFKPFTAIEIRQFIALYILQGLSPSPQIKMKFNPQAVDKINGNDMCSRIFGRDASRRHKMFKHLFTIQNPLKHIPSRKSHPNFKVDPFLLWIQAVSMDAYQVGKFISIDEQTIGFKGMHADKLRISYKKEGDGFQCDALCCNGYTYSFFMRNMPAPKKYLDKGLSPLHARCLFLMDQLKEKHHVCGMDNLYTSARFFREAYASKNKVLCHGVARRSGRGLPKSVIQDEVKNKVQQEKVRGTTKAAVLTGDPEAPDLVAFSVYDTKPVHFLSMACTGLKWIEKRKKVFDRESNKNVSMAFLRCEVTDTYNNGMNSVDIADQLRGTYRFDRWMRKRKWWWSIWMWGLQVLLVNAYLLYRSAHIIIWKTERKKILDQYKFREEIIKSWMDGDNEDELQQDSRKRKRSEVTVDSHSISLRSSTISESDVVVRGRRIDDKALDPTNGTLKCRLDTDFHFPIMQQSTNAPCGLCRWAMKEEVSRDKCRIRGVHVSRCDKCNISLCLACFKPFHTISDVKRLKSDVKKNYEQQKNG